MPLGSGVPHTTLAQQKERQRAHSRHRSMEQTISNERMHFGTYTLLSIIFKRIAWVRTLGKARRGWTLAVYTQYSNAKEKHLVEHDFT